jgi:hypothetical protein
LCEKMKTRAPLDPERALATQEPRPDPAGAWLFACARAEELAGSAQICASVDVRPTRM